MTARKTRYRKTPLKASGDPVRPEHVTELIPGVKKAIAEGKATPASGLLSLRLIQAFGLYNALWGQLPSKGRPKGSTKKYPAEHVQEVVRLMGEGMLEKDALKAVINHEDYIDFKCSPDIQRRRLRDQVRGFQKNK